MIRSPFPFSFSHTHWGYLRMDLYEYEHYIVPLNQRTQGRVCTIMLYFI